MPDGQIKLICKCEHLVQRHMLFMGYKGHSAPYPRDAHGKDRSVATATESRQCMA